MFISISSRTRQNEVNRPRDAIVYRNVGSVREPRVDPSAAKDLRIIVVRCTREPQRGSVPEAGQREQKQQLPEKLLFLDPFFEAGAVTDRTDPASSCGQTAAR